ncbi:redoxin domain-containing protein [Psychromonas sp. KJ10-10]|uniref:protein disulfide oxidoreductase n=1 Tax=Psychromonas sp. KJ10-10 TaxID=3391823 RepID=UPI0039B5E6E5
MSNDKQIKKPSNKSGKGWFGWLKEIALFILLAIVVGWGVDFWRSQSLASGEAPELVMQSVQGDNINLIEMSQEEPVLVYFWATWCSICTTVSPSVELVSNTHQVISVALNSGEAQRVKQYLQAKDYHFDVINDAKGGVGRDWGVSVTPTIFIINKGEISSVTTGFTSPFGMWLRLLMA